MNSIIDNHKIGDGVSLSKDWEKWNYLNKELTDGIITADEYRELIKGESMNTKDREITVTYEMVMDDLEKYIFMKYDAE